MRPVEFRGANLTLTAPEGLEGRVNPIRVFRSEEGAIVSCWEISEDELALLRSTRQIWLSLLSGKTAPPMLLSVVRPPEVV